FRESDSDLYARGQRKTDHHSRTPKLRRTYFTHKAGIRYSRPLASGAVRCRVKDGEPRPGARRFLSSGRVAISVVVGAADDRGVARLLQVSLSGPGQGGAEIGVGGQKDDPPR